MNGSSGFRGLPMTRAGAGATSTSTSTAAAVAANHLMNAAVATGNVVDNNNRPSWLGSPTSTDMSMALRAAFYPRLDTLASQLYSFSHPNAAAAAAHLSGLHAAAAAAANSSNAPTMPPPLSPYHPSAAGSGAAGGHPNSATIAHHALLSPYFYSAAAAYGGAASSPFTAGAGRPTYMPVDSAFLPAAGSTLPRYRYLLPTSSPSDHAAAAARNRQMFAAMNSSNAVAERTMSETTEPGMANRYLNRRSFSPPCASVIADPPSAAAAAAFYHQQNLINAMSSASSLNEAAAAGGQHQGSTRSIVGGTSSTSAAAAAAAAASAVTQPTSMDSRRNRIMSASLPTQPYYPSHFMKGTVIQLANGDLKRVEDLNTEDFVRSAHLTNDLKIDSSTVVRIDEKSSEIVLLSFAVGELKVQVSVEATVEHPFFVIGQGWSSCNPERTQNLYGLPCQRLQVGDICISLTHRDVSVTQASGSTISRQPCTTNQPALNSPNQASAAMKNSASSGSLVLRPTTKVETLPTKVEAPPTKVEAPPPRSDSQNNNINLKRPIAATVVDGVGFESPVGVGVCVKRPRITAGAIGEDLFAQCSSKVVRKPTRLVRSVTPPATIFRPRPQNRRRRRWSFH